MDESDSAYWIAHGGNSGEVPAPEISRLDAWRERGIAGALLVKASLLYREAARRTVEIAELPHDEPQAAFTAVVHRFVQGFNNSRPLS